MKKTILFGILTTIVAFAANAQIVNIPDPIFKNFLVNHYYHSNPGGSGIQINLDANNDGEIQYSEATSYPGDLVNYQFYMSGLGISDLTGIEAFTNIRRIYAGNNQLTSINVDACSSLNFLNCSGNPLTSLTINNASLHELTVNNCSSLTSVDIHESQNITSFTCQQNSNLTTLNLAGCWWLQELRVTHNPLLTSLDFGMVFYNYLTLLQCADNGLTALDVSHLPALQILVCTGNQLTSLNLANGHAQSFQTIYANGHPDLFCIQVDNVTVAEVLWAPGGYYAFDSWIVFNTDCTNYNPNPVCTVNIPDTHFKAELLANTAINTNANNEIECVEAVAYTGEIHVDNLNITDMTGIEAFVNITSLSCNDQQPNYSYSAYLDTLNISGLTALTSVSCTGNVELSAFNASGCTSLTSISLGGSYAPSGLAVNLGNCMALTDLNLDSKNLNALNISGCSALTSINCGNNQLTSLDISDSPALTSLLCNNNQLTSLNTFDNAGLETLDCSNNQLPYLIVSLNTALITLNCSYNQVSYLDLYNNAALTTLNCSHNDLNSISVNNNPALTIADCSYNNLTTLNVTLDAALTSLNCNYNQLATLDVSGNAALVTLQCGYNDLPGIDLDGNPVLENLYCAGNDMPDIDLGNNSGLRTLDCSYNQLGELDLTANTNLLQLNCAHNQIATLELQNDIPLFLVMVTCTHNQLTDLDLSNTYTTILFCDTNNLQTLNIANGMNTQPAFLVWANDNPDLVCVQVDNVEYSNEHWVDNPSILFDAGVIFSENCETPTATEELPDPALVVYPNPTRGMLYFPETGNARLTNAAGQILLHRRNVSTLDISDQPAGIYVLTLTTGNGKMVKQYKIVKE